MKKMKQIFYLTLILIPHFLLSQESFKSLVIAPIQKDALYREKVFIHINKTKFFTNENLWFTAYVGEDKNNIPSKYTTNLHVNLLDKNGDVLESKNIFINEGVGIGDFLIVDSYKPGKYYLQGYTNYMQNFGDENVFIQEIEIINPSVIKQEEPNLSSVNYDIQLFPESGYLMEGVNNIIGIKALVNGKGTPFSGEIKNAKGEIIVHFKSNKLGMGKCNLKYLKGETYTAVIAINNTYQQIKLPKAKETGVIFSIDNLASKEALKLTLKTNSASIPLIRDDSFALLIYRNNVVSEAVTLAFKSSDVTEQELFFDKDKLQNGVNVVTLFRENKPIAERTFFIDKPSKQTAVLIEELQTKNDSITFKIQTLNSNFESVQAQLSISILPKEAKSFSEKQTIKSAFLLTPYVKGKIENPAMYFKKSSSKKVEDLDLLLLNQGWIAYSLEEKIKKLNPKEQFQFESGFTVSGIVKKFPKRYDICILNKKNKLAAMSKFNENNEFNFKNIFAYKNDSIKIALITKGKPIKKPTKVRFHKVAKDTLNYKNLISHYNSSIYNLNTHPLNTSDKETILNLKGYPNLVVLNEVMLKTVASKKKKTIFDLEMTLARKHHLFSPSSYTGVKVTKLMETTQQNLFYYFRNLGYIRGSSEFFYISLRLGAKSMMARKGSILNPDGTVPPLIYVDDVLTPKIDPRDPIDVLNSYSLFDVDEILVNKSGAGEGTGAVGGIIRIYTKKGDHEYFEEQPKKLYKDLLLLTGYNRASNYYKPQFNIYTEEVYNWSEVAWENSLKTNEKGEVFIKIPTNEFSNEFQFSINGFSEKGLLFNTIFKTMDDDF